MRIPELFVRASTLLLSLGPLTLMAGSAAVAAPAVTGKVASAVVEEILDGNQLYIESRRARLQERAQSPQQIRTEASRGQLRFGTGASGRLNRFSQIRLGSSCFLLNQGEVLISGRQSGCTRSSRMSVRGTNYLVTLAPSGEADVKVLEGELELEPLVDGQAVAAAPVRLQEGQKARLSATGVVRTVVALTAAEVSELLAGPLFQGFRSPLADQAGLQEALRRRYPDLSLRGRPPTPSAGDPLIGAINAARAGAGRTPLQPLPPELTESNGTYLRPVLEGMLRGNSCDHDTDRWQAIQSEAVQRRWPLTPTSEVIACPGRSSQWNPAVIVERWLSSPLHNSILLNRPRASHIDCVTSEREGRSVAMCTLWSPAKP